MYEAQKVHAGMDGPELLAAAHALTDGEPSPLANLANLAALIYHGMNDLNWAGFYLYSDGDLVLGPFQGPPACTRIPLSKGVCGQAARDKKTLIVADVHEFPDHIACDVNSRSEIVVPLLSPAGELLGVLDLDSPRPGRFGAAEQTVCEALALIAAHSVVAVGVMK